MKITMAHGSGGKATSDLIQEIFARQFDNPVLNAMEDSGIVKGAAQLAMTTDSFVVTPLFFPGGDIGKLSICGTVNDLLTSGATPKYLTCGFIIEEGAEIDQLRQIAQSMAAQAKRAQVMLVAGDTKVIEGSGGIYINTAGVGFLESHQTLGASHCQDGDAVIVSGNLGDHHAAILSARMGIQNDIESDCACLSQMVQTLLANVEIHGMRDITRGGLATILNEFATASRCCIELNEERIPVSQQVQGFCDILGLDPLVMGNEGKMAFVVAQQDAQRALQLIRQCEFGKNAAIVGQVSHRETGVVLAHTTIGGMRLVPPLIGEGLPRIC